MNVRTIIFLLFFLLLLHLYNKTRSEANDGFDPSSGYWIEGVGSLAPNFCYSASWSAWHHIRLDQCYVDDELIFQLADLDQPVVDEIGAIPDDYPFCFDDIYDLSGHHMKNGALPKGVYIMNGKKVVIK